MIRIDLGKEVRPGVFAYSMHSLNLHGESRQPLLDACRQIKSMGDRCKEEFAAIYREGKGGWDMRCRIDVGAGLTVSDPAKGRPHFAKYQEVDWSLYRGRMEAAE